MEDLENSIHTAVAPSQQQEVFQFSIFLDGKEWTSSRVIKLLSTQGIIILAFSFVENYDCAIMRIVVNYPEVVEKTLTTAMVHYLKTPVVAIEMEHVFDLQKLSNALFSAEVKVHYMYPFLARPNNKVAVVIQSEQNPFLPQLIHGIGMSILSQNDIGR